MRFLFSHWYLQGIDFSALLEEGERSLGEPVTVMVDSGGFSAMSAGAKVDLGAYVAWLHEHGSRTSPGGSRVSVYANLDVIGDWRATARNQAILEARGLTPLPVWHVGSPLHELRRLAREYGRVAIGGMVALAGSARLIALLDDAWHVLDGFAGLHVHGFGITRSELLARYPWKTVDSSTWANGCRWGAVHLFDPKLGRYRVLKFGAVGWLDQRDLLVRTYGVRPTILALLTASAGSALGQVARESVLGVAAMSMLVTERWLRERGKPVEVFLAAMPCDFLPTVREIAACRRRLLEAK